MNLFFNHSKRRSRKTLVIGATGKTGSRIAERLTLKDVPIRAGSRTAMPAFDWLNPATWDACLRGIGAVYISYAGDLAVAGASDTIGAFVEAAKANGVRRAVILTGRGESEALASEKLVQESGLDWTVIRASWFNQNFSEGAFTDMVHAGQITLPAGDVREPFIDVDDIADVAVAALTEPGHAGEIYEVTGPRLMTFSDIAADLSRAIGRDITYTGVPHDDFIASVADSGAPEQVVWLMDYLFGTILDGRNAYLTQDVERAIGRPPKDFADYARNVAATGYWRAVA